MICVGGLGMKVFADGFEKQKIFLLALSILIEPSSGTTAEAVSSLGEMTTVHSMFFQDRRSTPITSRWVDEGRLFNDLHIRWRMSVVLVMTRRGASFSPAMPLTRWTRSPASSATTKWSSLKGEEVSVVAAVVSLIVADIRWLTGHSSSPPGSTARPVSRWRRRVAPASCPRCAWPAWRAGPAGCSAGTTTALRSGTALSSSLAPCTAMISSPRSPAAPRDSRFDHNNFIVIRSKQ